VPVFTAQKLRTMLDINEIATLKIESIRQAFARWLDLPEIWHPATRETADHSLPCTVAMGMIDGTITPAMMEGNRFKDADVLALMAKCSIELPDEFADLAPETRCCRLTATLKNGDTVVAETRRSLADDVADPGWFQAVDKFKALSAPLLDERACACLVTWVDMLELHASVGDLVELTKIA